MPRFDISIVIVNYNVKDFLLKCLNSIELSFTKLKVQTIVVDNDSKDGSVDYLEPKFPDVKFIRSNKNLGFGKANNLGFKNSDAKYILILNPDTILEENTLQKMFDFMENNPDIGISGCKVLNPDGTFQLACRRGFPTPWASFTKLFGLQSLFPNSKIFAQYNQTYKSIEETYEIDAVIGAFMFCRAEVIDKTKGFDEDFFMYGEDIDLCYRTQQLGWKVFYYHETTIIHYKGESTRRSTINEMKHFYQAMEIFASKHYSNSKLFLLLLRTGIYIRFLLSGAHHIRKDLLFIAVDLLLINSTLLMGTWIRKGSFFAFPDYGYPDVFIASSLVLFASNIITGEYFEETGSIKRFVFGSMITFFILSFLMYFQQDFAFSRAVLLFMVGSTTILGASFRVLIRIFDHSIGSERIRSIILAGDGKYLQDFIDELQKRNKGNFSIIGVVQTGNELEIDGKFENLGSLEYIPELIKKYRPDDVIITDKRVSKSQLMKIVSKSSEHSVRFHLADEMEDFIATEIINELSGEIPDIPKYNIDKFRNRLFKRIIDISFALFCLTIGLPFLLIFKSKSNQSVNRIWDVFTGTKSVVGIFPTNEPDELGKNGLISLAVLTENSITNKSIKRLNQYYLTNYTISLDIDIIIKYFFRKRK